MSYFLILFESLLTACIKSRMITMLCRTRFYGEPRPHRVWRAKIQVAVPRLLISNLIVGFQVGRRQYIKFVMRRWAVPWDVFRWWERDHVWSSNRMSDYQYWRLSTAMHVYVALELWHFGERSRCPYADRSSGSGGELSPLFATLCLEFWDRNGILCIGAHLLQ